MKSTEVYRSLRTSVGPWFKARAYRRTSGGMLGWHRPVGDRHLVVWFQCDQHGWDRHAGSKFTMEFSQGADTRIGTGDRRVRLPGLLPPVALEELRAIQNRILARLQAPADHLLSDLPESVRRWYLKQFETHPSPYQPSEDVWLRYHGPADVEAWGKFVLAHLPALEARAEVDLARRAP